MRALREPAAPRVRPTPPGLPRTQEAEAAALRRSWVRSAAGSLAPAAADYHGSGAAGAPPAQRGSRCGTGHAGVPVILRPGGSEELGAEKGPWPTRRAGVRSLLLL